ncbi:MAG: DJ-1/PfpI family protein [Lentisphaeria bacterium]|nr:DJ-1/PfpI family protein [Lentisphaeria bacterium]
MLKNALIFLAPGFEELEALAPVDVLRRAGVNVVLAGVQADSSNLIPGAHGVKVLCDLRAEDVNPADFDLVYYPGGMPGAANLAASKECLSAARSIYEAGGYVCAICAAPIVLEAAGLLDGQEYTCYPGFESKIAGGKYTGKFIQKSGRILTACGPAAALDFALEILRATGATALASQLSGGMMRK